MATVRYPNLLSLDVAGPDEVARVLREAASTYRESGSELEAAWQDAQPRKDWERVARVLESAADRLDDIFMDHNPRDRKRG